VRRVDRTTSDDFTPAVAASAFSLASESRRRQMRLLGLRIAFVTLAAGFGAFSLTWVVAEQRLDVAGMAAVLAFTAVLGVRLVRQSENILLSAEAPARAAGELAVSHAWRYAVGARPYGVLAADARRRLRFHLDDYRRIVKEYQGTVQSGNLVPEGMTGLRSETLQARQEAYLTRRIDVLLRASGKAGERSRSRDRSLLALVISVEVVGIPIGTLKALGLLEVNLLGVVAAAAAGIALWMGTLDYPKSATLAANINATVSSARDALQEVSTEHDWSVLVARVEDQLMLEHEAVLAATHPTRSGDARMSEGAHTMTPDEYFAAAEDLKRQIWEQGDKRPKLEPDVIVALNPGGAILGGMLYFMTTRAGDFFPLSLRCGLQDADLKRIVGSYSWQARRGERLSILVVDASVKSGNSLARAIRIIREVVESQDWQPATDATVMDDPTVKTYTIHTAVIANRLTREGADLGITVDYFFDEVTEKFPYGNV
jgi:hypoxanthine phosphoribosyltransferase